MGEEEVKEVVRRLIREEVDAAVDRFREEYAEHFKRAAKLLDIVEELGPIESLRERMTYMSVFIAREKDRAALRRAVIEKSLVAAVWAVIGFLALAAWRYFTQMVKGE